MTDDEAVITILGTSAGRIWPEPGQSGISTALTVGDHHYVVDLGYGWGQRFQEYGLGDGFGLSPLRRLRAVLITHLHSDHTIGLAELIAFGPGTRSSPVDVIGPGARGQLPPLHRGIAAPPVVSPEQPMPGTRETVARMCSAFASDLNENMRDSGKPHPDQVLRAYDVPLPAEFRSPEYDLDDNPCPDVEPFVVFEDDRVQVTATLVDHRPMWPALAYRFETDAGSVTFSGDTAPCSNLVRLARNTDVLVHEANDPHHIARLLPEPRNDLQQAKLDHLLRSHTSPEEAGRIAKAAGARSLVLTHLGRTDGQSPAWDQAGAAFDGNLIVAQEGMTLNLHCADAPLRQQTAISTVQPGG